MVYANKAGEIANAMERTRADVICETPLRVAKAILEGADALMMSMLQL